MEHHHEKEIQKPLFPVAEVDAKRFLRDDDPRYSLTESQLSDIEKDGTFRKFQKRYDQSARRLEKEGKLYDIARGLIQSYIQSWKIQHGVR